MFIINFFLFEILLFTFGYIYLDVSILSINAGAKCALFAVL